MQINIMERLYSDVIDTLNLFLLPPKQKGESYLSTVQFNLAEIEGDCYTFFHKKNIKILYDKGYFSIEVVGNIERIRNSVENIDNSLWNPTDFIINSKWKEIRQNVIEVILQI
jgi:hypothetical protein